MLETWVEVSRDALRANFESVAKHAGVAVCAVVKADGYGHGIVESARTFVAAGAAMLGVTRLDEARALRAAGITAPVLLFMPVADPAEAVSLGCEVTVGSAHDIAPLPANARVHLKVDTGMGRLGVPASEAVPAAQAIAHHATLAGVWTHFAEAARSGGAQLDRFNAVLNALRHHGIEAAAHASNSEATLALPDARFDMVRVGTLLYGQDPPGARAPWPHAETFTWYARVVSVRTLGAGATVGYGSEWRARRPVRVATIPVGYADGFTVEPHARSASAAEVVRALKSSVGHDRLVYFGARPARVVGRVAMQAITVSLEGLDDVVVDAVARIPARRLMVSPSIERVYT